ncbi:TPA: hypothetical protein ACH3X1_003213 [Trebouxia sp. C0004]
MEDLPDEVLQQIFSALTARDLLHATWTCTAWRQLLLGNQTWWRTWCDHRWCASTELLARGSNKTSLEHPVLNDDWQQYALTRGLHIPWRYKPVKPSRLLYCVGRQDGWDRRGHPPPVLVEGDWALLTCTPGRAGPSGGRDRLLLIKLKSPTKAKTQQVPMSQHGKYWLDFGTNKYKPYALQGGATDLHMPFVAQGRASDVVVWKAEQQYPMAVLHQRDGATVPAVAIERTPWGQQEQADSLRLVSCSNTGKVCVWLVGSGRAPTALWQGQAAELCGMQRDETCCIGALAMWSLSRPRVDGRNACCIAVGTLGFGVALLILTFHQHGPTGIASQRTRLIPHTASVLRMCVSWDVMPPVCPFPTPPRDTQSGPRAEAAALMHMGLPLVAPNISLWQGLDPTLQSLSDASEYQDEDSEVLGEAKQPERSASASPQGTAQQNRNWLAAACDKTHLFVIWGPLPVEASDQNCHGEASSSHAVSSVESAESSAALAAPQADVAWPGLSREASWQPGLPPATDAQTDAPSTSSSSHSGSHSNTGQESSRVHVKQHSGNTAHRPTRNAFGVNGGGAVDDPDDLVACLQRLRPHLHASGPFSLRAASGSTHPPSHSPAPQRSTPYRSLDDCTGQTTVQHASSTQQRTADQSVQQHQQKVSSEAEGSAQHQAGLSAGSWGDNHSGAYLPWPCLKGPFTPAQLQALKICCSTVACFDVPHQPANLGYHGQGDDGDGKASQQERDQGSEAEPLHLLGDSHGCGVQPLWRHPVVGAAHLSAADGAVAIACSDGMLLLLDQATGQLIRRVPHSQLDQRFKEHQKSLASVHTAWLDPSPVLDCTVWWGCSGSSPIPNDYTLTVVTELPLAGVQTSDPKELCIEQYACAENAIPVCNCKDSREPTLALLRTTVTPYVASASDQEQQDSILWDIQSGAGHPLGNMYSLGIQLPHQRVARRYFTCGRRTHWPFASGGCNLAAFFD